MANTNRKTHERNGIESIAENDEILQLNEKYIEEGLNHKHLREITTKYHPGHKKHRYGLVGKPKKEWNRTFVDEKLPVKWIMDCRTTSAHTFGN